MSSHFDLDSYISNYQGHTKIIRLKFISERIPELADEALKMAIDLVKQTRNVALYLSLIEAAGDRLGDKYTLDTNWVETTKRENLRELESLDQELSKAKRTAISEYMRMSHNNFGLHYYLSGNLVESLRSYLRTWEYCSNSKHIIEMCVSIIKVAIESNIFVHVSNYVNRAEQQAVAIAAANSAAGASGSNLTGGNAGGGGENVGQQSVIVSTTAINPFVNNNNAGGGGGGGGATPGSLHTPTLATSLTSDNNANNTNNNTNNNNSSSSNNNNNNNGANNAALYGPLAVLDLVTIGKLVSSEGLAHLDGGRLRNAARSFIKTPIELGSHYNDVISAQDIALYGALCALATFSRSELKTKVIESPSFKQYLELFPDVREIVTHFYNSNYTSCLSLMEKIRPDVVADLYLSKHVEALYSRVRNRAIVQYTTPYSSVRLATMAAALNASVEGLENELSNLIVAGEINARIDSHNKILYSKQDDFRSATFRDALQMGQEYNRTARALLLRVELIRNDFCVRGHSQ